DSGSVWLSPGTRVARLDQDVPIALGRSVFDVVADGLGELSALVAAYHRAALKVAEDGSPGSLEALGRLQHELEERDGWRVEKRVAEEEAWLRQGIKARRTRNEGRVRALMAMRQERAARRDQPGAVRLHIERAQASGRLVVELDDVGKVFGDRWVVRHFSARV